MPSTESRIEAVLEDSESSVIVTTPPSKHLVPASYKGRVVNLDPNGAVEVCNAEVVSSFLHQAWHRGVRWKRRCTQT